MKRLLRRTFLRTGCTVAMFFACLDGHAIEFTVHASPIGEYMTQVGSTLESSPGLMTEILAGALRNEKIQATMAPESPWRRAQATAKDQPGAVLAILARTPERENLWNWLAITYTDKVYAYTLADQPTYASYAELRAKDARVGVKAGSASESLLRGMGAKIEGVTHMEQNFLKLFAERLDVVVLQGMEVYPALQAAKERSTVDLSAGTSRLARTALVDLPLWVVTSKLTPEGDAHRLKVALEKFKLTLEYKAIVKRYEDKQKFQNF